MTLGAIVIPLAALAVCGLGLWLAWRLVRRAEGAAEEAAPQTPSPSAAPPARPSSARMVGQLMALAGAGLGVLGIALVLWRAFDWPPLGLVLLLATVGAGMAFLAWRVLRRRRGVEP